jgi:hypothetical protein
MRETTPVQIIRHVHRWSGVALILLVGMKMLSGFRLAGLSPFPGEAAARWMHFSRWVDVPLLLLFSVHASYGVLRIRMSRIRRKVPAFMVASAVALAVFLFFVRYLF